MYVCMYFFLELLMFQPFWPVGEGLWPSGLSARLQTVQKALGRSPASEVLHSIAMLVILVIWLIVCCSAGVHGQSRHAVGSSCSLASRAV